MTVLYLCRAELTPAQRAAAIQCRKQIWEALHPENQVAQIAPPEIGYRKPPPQSQAFAAETSSVSGESKSQINRHLSRAEALGDDLLKVAGRAITLRGELWLGASLSIPLSKNILD